MNEIKQFGFVVPVKPDNISEELDKKCQDVAALLYADVITEAAEGVAWMDAVNSDADRNDDIAYRILELVGAALMQQRTISANRTKMENEQYEKLQDKILAGILGSKNKNTPSA